MRGLALLGLFACAAWGGERTGSIAGQVRGADGKAAAGVSILVAREKEPRWPGSFAVPEGATATTTDARGRYVVEALEPGEYYVSAWLPGLPVAEYGADTEWREHFAVRVGKGAAIEGIDMTLVEGLRVRGTVRDLDGRPMKGVLVLAIMHGAGSGQGRTGADGVFELGPWPVMAPAIVDLSFQDRDHVFPSRKGLPARPGEILDAGETRPLAPARVRGVLMDPGGRPGAGRLVRWRAKETRTDGEGRFVLEGLPPGKSQLRCETAMLAPFHVLPLELAPGDDIGPIRIELREPLAIRGRVVDSLGRAREGVPVAAAPLAAGAVGDRYEENRWTVTGEDGRFELAGLQPGRHLVACNFSGSFDDRIEVDAGAEKVEILVPVAGSIRGVLDLPRAEDPPYATIDLFLDDRPAGVRFGQRFNLDPTSPQYGAFLCEPRDKGIYRVHVEVDGFAEQFSAPLKVEGGRGHDLGRIRLCAPGTIGGVVRDEEGRPLRHAKVHVADATGGVYRATDFSDVEGRFACRGLPPGRFRLFAMAPGRPLAVGPEVKLEERGTAEAAIVAQARSAYVRIRVRDPGGAPVVGAEVFYRPEGLPVRIPWDFETYEPSSYGDEWTDAAGIAEKPLLPPGETEIAVTARRGGPVVARRTVRLEAGAAREVEFTVSRAQ